MTSSHSLRDQEGFNGSGLGSRCLDETSDEWQSLFEPSKESGGPNKDKMKEMLHLDLTNFEDPGTEGSRYVLTSPRSLEACARFGVKPVELLHKSYEEFIDEYTALYNSNYSHEAIYEVFQEHERQRKRKLRLCQEERDRIIREQERRKQDVVGEFTDTTGGLSPSKQQNDYKQMNRNDSGQSNMSSAQQIKQETSGTKWKSPSHSSSSERKERSAWSRETPVMPKLKKSQSFSSHGIRTRGEPSNSCSRETASPRVRRARSQWSIPKDGSLPGSPRLTRRDSESSTGSLTRLSSKTKSKSQAMSTDCILNAVGGSRVSDEDQKIIDLMLTRHEEAEQLRSDKRMLDLAWDDQRRLETDLRQARIKQRNAELYEQYSAKEVKQMEVRARKERKDQKLKQEKQEAIRAKQLLWEQEKQKQEQTLANKIELKRLADAEKKRQQEEKRRQKQREDEMNRNIAYLSLLEKHEKAMKNRNLKVTHEQFKLQIQNESEKAKIMEKREEVEKRERDGKLNLKNEITEKHRRAIENYEEVLNRRENEIRDSKRKKREKVVRQREQLNRMETELSSWQKNLKTYQKESLKRAEALSAMNITKKQLKARTHLKSKETEHAENFERVREEEERRKLELKQQIDSKDERSELVNIEKEEIRKMSREAAQSSQAIRSIIKEKTFKRSFDIMARAAEIRANIGRGPRKAYKNQSTFMLG